MKKGQVRLAKITGTEAMMEGMSNFDRADAERKKLKEYGVKVQCAKDKRI